MNVSSLKIYQQMLELVYKLLRVVSLDDEVHINPHLSLQRLPPHFICDLRQVNPPLTLPLLS